MSRRSGLVLCLTIAALAVVVRSSPFMAPGVRFDADQSVVGLMAKHISEGRAFPVYFYGQSYLLAVEAYLAAPVMWVLGPTEVALKLPLLAMNLATVLLLVWRAHRDLGLAPWLVLAGALPLARHWVIAAILVVATQAGVAAVAPHGDMYGPGSARRAGAASHTVGDAIASQVCLTPSAWPARVQRLVTEHLPLMAGGRPGPMIDVSISSGMGHGNPGLAF